MHTNQQIRLLCHERAHLDSIGAVVLPCVSHLLADVGRSVLVQQLPPPLLGNYLPEPPLVLSVFPESTGPQRSTVLKQQFGGA